MRKEKFPAYTRIFNHEFKTTGILGASKDQSGELSERGFPSWIIIPSYQWLAMARHWHFFIAWLFVLNGLTFVTYSILSRHLRCDLVPTKQDWQIDRPVDYRSSIISTSPGRGGQAL